MDSVIHSLVGGGEWRRCHVSHHRGFQLILAYSWARPAILIAGKGREGMFYFFCFFTFIPVPLSSLSLSFISSTISSVSFLPFSGRRHKLTYKGWHVIKPQHNQSIIHSLELRVRFSAADILKYFILIFPETRIWHFMQIVSYGDNLHERFGPIFWKKIKKKYHQFVACWISQKW